MPCSPNDITITEPSGSSIPPINGFGTPFAPSLPDVSLPFPDGFPEDLLEIFDLLQFVLPAGIVKPALNPNYGKDIFDGIMKLMDQFFPFLMMYKFFLPVLDLIICIIEVLCAIANPFKLIRALKRLFRRCLPAFLSLFPIFALIVMLISLLLLILSLIEYIISQIVKLVELMLKNIKMLVKATSKADGPSILAAAKKLGTILCAFQNLFVLLAIFKTILDLIKDILKMTFSIPPCDGGDNSDADNCCTTDVCPAFIKNNETLFRTTGTLQYYNQVAVNSGLTLPVAFGNLLSDIRTESWQFFDSSAAIADALINITHAYDLPQGINQVFFPTDSVYAFGTPVNQAPYTVDLRLYYVPSFFGRSDVLGSRYIRIKDCIVTAAPSVNLSSYNNTSINTPNGVIKIVGGTAVEDDGLTQIFISGSTGTLENVIHLSPVIGSSPVVSPTDGYGYTNVEYTFKINHEVLLLKSLITLGCIPSVALDRSFINTVFGGNVGANTSIINNIINGPNFPDIGGAQDCLSTALINLRNNLSAEGVANFQAATTACLNNLKDNTTTSLNGLVGLGFDPNASVFTIDPSIQFTSQSIKVQVALNERNGQPITAKFPADLAKDIADKIKPIINFGQISQFTYDGVRYFTADITSSSSGSGQIKMLFDNQLFTTASIPADINQSPVISEQVLDYTFIYSPSTEGKPNRDEGDVSRDASTESSRG